MRFLQQLKEFFSLLGTRFVVGGKNFREYLRTIYHYYGKGSFAKQDTALLGSYLFQNPFGISKRFLKERGEEDLYTYGETPLTTLELIAKKCGIQKKDTVLELGCGRGRTCFWLHHFIGCKVTGVDYVPAFIEIASRVRQAFKVEGVEFLLSDMDQVDLEGASVIYLYGTCLEDAYLKKLAKKFEALPVGTKVITVSYPITDYGSGFELMKRFEASFTWGKADVYLQIRTI